jgi:hypothetical protein
MQIRLAIRVRFLRSLPIEKLSHGKECGAKVQVHSQEKEELVSPGRRGLALSAIRFSGPSSARPSNQWKADAAGKTLSSLILPDAVKAFVLGSKTSEESRAFIAAFIDDPPTTKTLPPVIRADI